ncbi:restriction endonuclease subunit S [Bacillus infantis]|uniref:restriction endonuclease subunit S n=1 Tax=Bacillus infantis TaxID=324767 RepID=UPI001CD52996|nr:restriction endonuclease subunit S [Bacillus infantis]MCA1037498.1 restriction endonuclease subunit S [Bacillus infantis]HER2025529.1 restriction endonuclease subunit S [Streptococcus pyogenes]
MMIVEKRTVHDGYKMTELGEIPVEWEVNSLGLMTEIIMGQSPSSSSYNDQGHGLPFYQGKTEFGSKYPRVRKWCSEPTKIAEAEDVLISVRAPVGEVNMCRETSCIGRGLGAIRAIIGKSTPWFLYYTLQNAKTRFESLGQGSTFTAINGGELRNLFIIFPPLKEQERIAEILATVDEQIENTKKLIEETKELKKGLMQQLLTKGIGHTHFKNTDLGAIPVGWEIHSMEAICERIIVGIASSTTEHYSNKENGVPIIRNQNIKENILNTNDLLYISYEFDNANSKKRLKVGDLLTVRTGYPGITAVVTSDFEGCQSFTTLISTPKQEIVNSNYIAYYLNSPLGKEELKKLSAGGAQQNLNVGSLSKYRIKLPGIVEQKKIAEILSAVDDRIESYEKEKERFIELKKGLMQKLLTGKIRVQI